MQIVDRNTNAALAAAGRDSVLLDTQLNNAPFNGYLEVGVVGGAGLTYDLLIGGRAVATDVPVRVGTTYPVQPDELDVINERVWASSPMQLRVKNPTAGALAYWSYVKLSDVPRSG